MIIDGLRLIMGTLFIAIGIFIFVVATVGLYKFKFMLNRAQVAAKNDTLATLSIVIGLMFFSGWSWVTLKLMIVAIFLWITNPVGTHLITETEYITNDQIEKELKEV